MEKITIKSLFELHFVSSPGFSPDGSMIAFIVQQGNYQANSYAGDLWIFEPDSGQVRRLTRRGDVKSYFWTNKNTLLFPAKKKTGNETVFYEIDPAGGEALAAFTLPFPVGKLEQMEDGRYLVLARWQNGGPKSENCEVIEEAPFWSNGQSFTYGIRSRLFLFDPASEEKKRLLPLTGEWFDISTYRRRGDMLLISGMEWREHRYNWNEVRLYNWKTGDMRILIEKDSIRTGDTLEFLSDEEALITVSDNKRYGWSQYPEFYNLNLKTAKLTPVASWEYAVGVNSVNSDAKLGGGRLDKMAGGTYWFVSTIGDESGLCRLKTDGTVEQMVEFGCAVDGFDVYGDHVVECKMSGPAPAELYYDGKQVTDFNGKWLKNHRLSIPEPVCYTGTDGVEIHGWVLPPTDVAERDPLRRYPAILHIHGGPRTVFGPVYHHEMQLWANAGYFVFFCNPRGSDGRGNEFGDIREKYGTVEYQNLMEFTDEVLRRYPMIDQTRVGVTGGSYGGFMTNWIIGHTNRFAAAVSQRSISSWLTMEYTSDIGYIFNKRHHNTYTRENPEKLWDCSPLKYADRCVTPTLFIHADEDMRCWMVEGLSMFSALKLHGCPARMCLFHGESHELSRSGKPRNRSRRMKEILKWMNHYLKGEEFDEETGKD